MSEERKNFKRGPIPRPLAAPVSDEAPERIRRVAKGWDELMYDGSLRPCVCSRVAIWWSIGGAEPTMLRMGCDKETRRLFATGHSTRVMQRLCVAMEKGSKVSLLPSLELLEPRQLAEMLDLKLADGTVQHYRETARRKNGKQAAGQVKRNQFFDREQAERLRKLL